MRAAKLLSPMVLLALAGAACATQQPFEPLNQTVDVALPPDSFERLGPVRGTSCRNVIMKIFALTSPTVLEAEMNARQGEPDADLIFEKNIYAEGQTVVPFVFTRRCISLEGVAIRLRGRHSS